MTPTPCACGHPAAVHAHYRPGSDCGSCSCPRLRRRLLARVIGRVQR